MKKRFGFRMPCWSCLAGPAALLALVSVAATVDHPFALRHGQALLRNAPFAPPPTGRRVPTSVDLRLEVREQTIEVAPGVTYEGATFGGSFPGPMIRVFEGDRVTVHFTNHPDNRRTYSIDFHAAAGADGTQRASAVPPGDKTTFTFTADRAGLYLYEAGGEDGSETEARGAAGLMLVEPAFGFRRAHREYYLMRSEFGTAEHGKVVVFNGREGALTGDGTLLARTGERIRLFVGNAGPNLPMSLHLEGKVQDLVYDEGGMAIHTGVQTTMIPAGGTAVVELDLLEPGEYELMDQELSSTEGGGARGLLRVEGEPVEGLGVARIAAAQHVPPANPGASNPAGDMTPALQEKIAAGEQVFARTCIACHQANGQGIAFVYPPLAKSDYLIEDLDRAILGVLKGQMGEMVVRGQKFNMLMPAQMLPDDEVAQVLTYVLNSFGNPGGEITTEHVTQIRESAP